MDALIAAARREIPDFGHRQLTLAHCQAQGITVDVRPYLFDEHLSRRGRRPRITLIVGLAPVSRGPSRGSMPSGTGSGTPDTKSSIQRHLDQWEFEWC